MTLNEAQRILARVKYKNWRINILHAINRDMVDIRWSAPCKNADSLELYDTAEIIPINNHQPIEYRFFEQMDEKDFIHIIYQGCQRLEMHELMEHFKVDNKWFKNPHPELDKK